MNDNESEFEKPRSTIENRIFDLTTQLHIEGHTRKEIVYYLREVANTYENYWSERDSWDKSPSEKDVTLAGDFEDGE